MSLSVIVLAAGRGERMKSTQPKVLHSLAGKPLLHHILSTVEQLSVTQMLVVCGYQGQTIIDQTKQYSVDWVWQQEQRGTGHAVKCALPSLKLSERVLILCGDVPGVQLKTLESLLQQTPVNAVGVLTAKVEDPTGLGRIIRNENGHVVEIVEHKDATAEQLAINEINTGIYVVPQAFLTEALSSLKAENAQQEYYLPDIIHYAVQKKIAVCGIRAQNSWEVLGVNSKQELARLERLYQQEQANQLMADGVMLLDPQRLDLRGEVNIGQDVTIDINVILEGKVTIGSNVQIGPNVVIKDSVIGDGAVILANSHVDSAHIGAKCQVGPFARIRPGTRLAETAKIGNFVETKKTEIGVGSKINHLSYIGDSQVGAGVNIGAGTITCNYDGVNKYQTVIEDNVFVGSNTELVAPVRVGRGATIAAGTTLVKDAPAGELSLTQKKQTVIECWERPTKRQSQEKS